MKIIEPSIQLLNPPDYKQMLQHIELAARTCYKSEDKISEESADNLITRLIASGHHSVLEHCNISIRIICDRGVSHELVRHRLCSFSQESTRYCNYSGDKFGNELTVIRPCFWPEGTKMFLNWRNAVANAEFAYFKLLENEATPQEARSVLPNSLKTDIVVTANIREWRTIFGQRCASAAHPQMRQVMLPLLYELIHFYPVLFSDLTSLWTEGRVFFESKDWKLAEVL